MMEENRKKIREFTADHTQKTISLAVMKTEKDLHEVSIKMALLSKDYLLNKLKFSEIAERMGQTFTLEELVLNAVMHFISKIEDMVKEENSGIMKIVKSMEELEKFQTADDQKMESILEFLSKNPELKDVLETLKKFKGKKDDEDDDDLDIKGEILGK
jgi:hypothetical protein